MTHSPGDRQATDALRELHILLSEDEPADVEFTAYDTDEQILDPATMEAIRSVGMEAMSPEARDLLLRLTDFSENLEPAARSRLVSAAERALQWRRDNSGSLSVLLFAQRRARKLTAEDISISLEVPAKTLTDIEAGVSPMQTLPPDSVATWIDVLEVEFDSAEAALRRGLDRRPATARAAGAALDPVDSNGDRQFADQVLARLRDLRGTPGTS